jgi:hypothetical protein
MIMLRESLRSPVVSAIASESATDIVSVRRVSTGSTIFTVSFCANEEADKMNRRRRYLYKLQITII